MQSSIRFVLRWRSVGVLSLFVCLSVMPSSVCADERFSNELNSDVEEPRILLQENAVGVPIRPASSHPIHSTDSLVQLVIDTRESQRKRLLSTDVHTPWQIMHGLLGLRRDFIISHEKQTVNGLEWIASGPRFRNEAWFERTKFGGRAHPYSVPYAFEGHVNQLLAILSMSGLPLDYEFETATGPIKMRDMLANAQKTVNDREEITWTLWALSRYLPPDAQWRNAQGELWSIERMVKLQVDKPLQGSPCGGTHGLFALAHARNIYLRKGKPLRGVWLEAEQKIRRYTQTARMQQNSDGTLSSNFFKGREYKQDFDKRMESAGHILEFLMIALPQEELSQPWVRRAIEATCRDLMNNRHEYVSCSPLYHTVNALSTYLERVAPSTAPQQVAGAEGNTRTIAQSRILAEPSDTSRPEATAAPQEGTGETKSGTTSPVKVAELKPEVSVSPTMTLGATEKIPGAPVISSDAAASPDTAMTLPVESGDSHGLTASNVNSVSPDQLIEIPDSRGSSNLTEAGLAAPGTAMSNGDLPQVQDPVPLEIPAVSDSQGQTSTDSSPSAVQPSEVKSVDDGQQIPAAETAKDDPGKDGEKQSEQQDQSDSGGSDPVLIPESAEQDSDKDLKSDGTVPQTPSVVDQPSVPVQTNVGGGAASNMRTAGMSQPVETVDQKSAVGIEASQQLLVPLVSVPSSAGGAEMPPSGSDGEKGTAQQPVEASEISGKQTTSAAVGIQIPTYQWFQFSISTSIKIVQEGQEKPPAPPAPQAPPESSRPTRNSKWRSASRPGSQKFTR